VEGGTTPIVQLSAEEAEELTACLEAVRVARAGTEGRGGAELQLASLVTRKGPSRLTAVTQILLRHYREETAQERLTAAMFWLQDRSNARAAKHRLELLLREYPEYSRTDEVLYQLATIESDLGNHDEAIGYLRKLTDRRGRSPRRPDARRLLDELQR
jgi:hypothetical protein